MIHDLLKEKSYYKEDMKGCFSSLGIWSILFDKQYD